jgi:hypothetical protein
MISAAEEINNCNKKGIHYSGEIRVAIINLHDYFSIDSFCISIHDDFWFNRNYYGESQYYYHLEDIIFIIPPTNRETEFAALIGFEPMNTEIWLKLNKHISNGCSWDIDLIISECSD